MFGWNALIKPGRGAQLDGTHPSLRNLIGFWPMREGAGTSIACVNNTAYSGTTTGFQTAWGATPAGSAIITNTTGYLTPANAISLAASTGITYMWAGTWGGVAGSNPGFWRSTLGGIGAFFIIQGANSAPWMRVDNTDVLKPSSPAIPANRPIVLWYVWRDNVQAEVWWDGILQTSASGSGTHAAAASITLFGYQSDNSQYIKGSWVAQGLWGRDLSADEIRRLSANPWQLFAPGPLRSWAFFPQALTAYTLSAAGGTYSLTGSASSLLFGRKLVTTAGSYSLTGKSTSLLANRLLVTSAGAYSIGGQASGLLFGRVLSTAAGSYTLTGGAANLTLGFTLVASAGSYSLTGAADSFGRTYVLSTDAGAYSLTGAAATLTYVASTGQTFRQALYAKLGSIPELVAIVGQAIYPGALPITHDFQRDGPALTYTVLTYPRGKVLSGADGTATARVQFSAWSYQEKTSDSIVLALWNAIDGTYNDSSWGNGTIIVMSSIRTEEIDLPAEPVEGSDQWIHQIPVEYSIKHRTKIPTNT